MSRRTFLAAGAATPFATQVLAHHERVSEADLDFRWSDDRQSLTITTRLVDISQDPPAEIATTSDQSWTLHRRAFGPDADFVLSQHHQGGDLKTYELRVVRAEYGRLRQRDIHLYFTQHVHPADPAQDARRVFGLHLVTNAISEPGSPSVGGFVGFGAEEDPTPPAPRLPIVQVEGCPFPMRIQSWQSFLAGAGLHKVLGAARVASTLSQVFGGIVQFAGATPTDHGGWVGDVDARFDLDQSWTYDFARLASHRKPWCIRSGIPADSLRVFWTDDAEARAPRVGGAGASTTTDGQGDQSVAGAAPGSVPTDLVLVGRAVVRPDAHGLSVVPVEGPGLHLRPLAPEETATVHLRTYRADPTGRILPPGQRAVSEASLFGDWAVEAIDDHTGRAYVGVLPKVQGRFYARAFAPDRADNLVRYARAGHLSFHGYLGEASAEGISGPIVDVETPIGTVWLLPLQDADDAERAAQATAPFADRFAEPVHFVYRWGDMPRTATPAMARATARRPFCDWVEINAAMVELDSGLRDAQFSKLTCDPSELRLYYAPDREETPARASVIRLGVPDGAVMARIDLARAKLRAARSDDLVELTFTFSDLMLRFADGAPPELVSGNASCFVPPAQSGRDESNIPDPRPILVVEFPPQHLLEEALFLPRQAELPDVTLKRESGGNGQVAYRWARQPTEDDEQGKPVGRLTDVSQMHGGQLNGAILITEDAYIFDPNNKAQVAELLRLMVGAEETAFRQEFAKRKSDTAFALSFDALQGDTTIPDEQKAKPKSTLFTRVQARFRRQAPRLVQTNQLPEPQTIYIGPVGLDIDAMHLARAIHRGIIVEMANELLVKLFEQVAEARRAVAGDSARVDPSDFAEALARERELEAAVPSYQLYRNFYREQMVAEATRQMSFSEEQTNDLSAALDLSVEHLEFINLSNPDAVPTWAQRVGLTTNVLRERKARVDAAFGDAVLAPSADAALERQTTNGLVDGRLSNPSRLAFRVPCPDAIDTARLDVPGLDVPSVARDANPRDRLAFSLNALTNFAAFELSVVRRAELVYEPDSVGRRTGFTRRLEQSARARLAHLGFQSGGYLTSSTRLADIQSSLQDPPDRFQTAIEIPARLTLSPHQEAVFHTPHQVESAIFDFENGRTAKATRLWTASLATNGINPGLRAVHSPDLRPDFVWRRMHDMSPANGAGSGSLPGGGAPPRGPLAPWLLARSDTGRDIPSPRALAEGYRPGENTVEEDIYGDIFNELLPEGQAISDEAFCAALDQELQGDPSRLPLPALIAHLCQRVLNSSRRGPTAPRASFRTGLDAYARHELVLLSSAWGLPVLGRRTLSGDLAANSSQQEVAVEDQLVDIRPGAALYQPQPLGVTELTMSALGGSFRHDTTYEPPAAAQFLDQTPLFDAMSVERWQQWTVLGRDVFCEIVYKGFLMPFGHRASLVQVTERTFLTDPAGGIWATLRQRMFIRIGRPEKRFPAIAQPYQGRGFPLDAVTFLTTQSPDIVDPHDPLAPIPPKGAQLRAGASGILDLGQHGSAGLAFWPRAAPTDAGNVRFEIGFANHTTELPVIFVDNVAANNPDTLRKIVNYYNSLAAPEGTTVDHSTPIDLAPYQPQRHWRTLALGGQKYRYAPEIDAGSASLETQHWTLRLTGGQVGKPAANAPDGPNALGWLDSDLNDFNFTPILNGADQPPFYPEVEVARVRLRQAERLTATRLPDVRARLDGDYLRFGLPADVSDADTHPSRGDNTSEVFLALLDMPSLGMGKKGDQSGGLVRPNGNLAAISRQKGALTLDRPRTLTTPSPAQDADTPVASRAPRVGQAFAFARQQVLPPVNQRGFRPKHQQSPAAAVEDIRKIYKNLFSDDAKLLGLVSLKDVMEFLDDSNLDDPDKGMPELAEKVRYGAQAVQAAQQGVGDAVDEAAGDAVDLVRANVLRPLRQGVDEIRDGWASLESEIARAQTALPDVANPQITLARALPELDQGLTGLSVALDASLAETDPIAFALSLGAVYEAGRRFIDAIAASASNPLERVSAALRTQYLEILEQFEDLDDFLVGLVKGQLEEALDELLDQGQAKFDEFIETVLNWIFPSDPNDATEETEETDVSGVDLIPLPPFGFVPGEDSDGEINEEDVENDQGVDLRSDVLEALAPELNKLRTALRLPLEDAKLVVRAFLRSVLSLDVFRNDGAADVDAALSQVVTRAKEFLKTPTDIDGNGSVVAPAIWIAAKIADKQTAVEDAIENLREAAETLAEEEARAQANRWADQIEAEAERYRSQFELLVETAQELEDQVDAVIDQFIDTVFEAMFDDRLGQALDTMIAVATLYEVVSNPASTLSDIANAGIAFVTFFTGPIGFDVDDVCKTMNRPLEAIRPIIALVDLSALAMARPTHGNRPVLVVDNEIRDIENARPEDLDGAVRLPGDRVFEAYTALKKAKTQIETAPVLQALEDFEISVAETDAVAAQHVLDSFKVEFRTAHAKVVELFAVGSEHSAKLYAALVNDAEVARGAQARLTRVAATNLCEQLKNVGGDGTKIGDLAHDALKQLPADLDAILRARANVLGAATEALETVFAQVQDVAKNGIVQAGGIAALFAEGGESLIDTFFVEDGMTERLAAEIHSAFTSQLAEYQQNLNASLDEWELTAREIDLWLASGTAELLGGALGYTQPYVQGLTQTLAEWDDSNVAGIVGDFVDLRAIRNKLTMLQQFDALLFGGGGTTQTSVVETLDALVAGWGDELSQGDSWHMKTLIDALSAFQGDIQPIVAGIVDTNVDLAGDGFDDILSQLRGEVAAKAEAVPVVYDVAKRYLDAIFQSASDEIDRQVAGVQATVEQTATSLEQDIAALRGLVYRDLRQVESLAFAELDGFVQPLLEAEFLPDVLDAVEGDRLISMAEFYETVLRDPRNALLDTVGSTFLEGGANSVLLVPRDNRADIAGEFPPSNAGNDLSTANDQLAADVAWLTHLAEPGSTPISDLDSRAFLLAFVQEWSRGRSTPLVIATQAANLVSEILSGDFLAAIDFNAIRDRIEKYLLGLVPQEITMSYSHGIKLSKSVERATQGIFIPGEGTQLTVGSTVTLKLDPSDLSPNIEFSSRGELGPFSIKLVGNFIDAVEIKFTGARFSAGSDGETEFDAEFSDAVIGRDLQFVQKFQKYLSPKPGSGVFVNLTFAPLGIEAGYRLSLGMFSVGAMSIFNVALSASAVLPFENKPALFKAGLSSRKSPFTISYLPYGGAGFFSITANPDGIVGFEASFEFGGAAAFGFGPLTGQGRLMAGVYIRQMRVDGRSLTEIAGTFFVGGSASIWIFSFGASLYVRLGMVNGSMSGEATFTYSFSIGLKDFDFSIQVWKQEGEGFSGDNRQASLGGLDAVRRFAQAGAAGSPARALPDSTAQLRSFGRCKGENWGEYRTYFADPPASPMDGVFDL